MRAMCRGGSRVRLVRRMTKLSFQKKIDTFYERYKYERSQPWFSQKIQNSAKIGLRYDHREYLK